MCNKIEKKCPKCSSKNQLPIEYGLIMMEAGAKSKPRTFIEGGCIRTMNDPEWYCEDCEYKWGRPDGDDNQN